MAFKDLLRRKALPAKGVAIEGSGSVVIGSTSTLVSVANDLRKTLTLTNISDEIMYIALGQAAAAAKGGPVAPGSPGGTMVIGNFTGAVYAICASGGKALCVLEV